MRQARLAPLLLALATATGCVTNPSTGRSQMLLLPANQVAAMGVEATPQVIAQFGGEVSSPELRAYVSDVGRSLVAKIEPGYELIDWKFYVLDSEVVNAFALPGGKIFITRGLLERFDNEGQLAGVLGHEIGHVTARHVDERLSQAMVTEFGLQVLGAYTEAGYIRDGANLAAQGVLLKFSRNQETESDDQGLKYMTAAGYDPEGLYQVLEVLVAASAASSRPAEIFSTHPYPETRMKRIQQELRGPYQHTRGNPAFGLYPARFATSAKPYLGR